MPAGIDDQRRRRLQRLDFREQQRALIAARQQARRRRLQQVLRACDLRRERRNAGLLRGLSRPGQRRARRLGVQPAHRDPRDRELVRRPRRRREGRGVEPGQRALGLVEAADQQQAADFQVARVGGVQPVARLLERRPGGVERLGGPAELARDQRDLGFGHDAARAGHRLPGAEGARRALDQGLGAREIAELRHGDAAQRQRRRVVTQRDPVECAQRITRRQRARRGRDQRVHGNPAKLVTPTVWASGPKCSP